MQPADPTIAPLISEPRGLRSWLRTPWDYAAMAGGLLYWAIFGVMLTIFGGILHLVLPRRLGESVGRRALHLLFHYFVIYLRITDLVRADLTALDAFRRIQGPIIAAPNHTALWDAVFLIARLPRAICVMKQAILWNPFLGGGARLAGYIPNGAMTRTIRDAANSLSHGGQLLLFPEGTRTRPDARWINPLKGGCAIIAGKAGVPVYPVFIRSNTRFLQKNWPLWRRPIFPIQMRIDLGEPLVVREGESSQDFTARLQSVYEQELARPDPLRRQVLREVQHQVHDGGL